MEKEWKKSGGGVEKKLRRYKHGDEDRLEALNRQRLLQDGLGLSHQTAWSGRKNEV